MVAHAGNVFDADGALTDDAIRTQLRDYLRGLVDFAGNR